MRKRREKKFAPFLVTEIGREIKEGIPCLLLNAAARRISTLIIIKEKGKGGRGGYFCGFPGEYRDLGRGKGAVISREENIAASPAIHLNCKGGGGKGGGHLKISHADSVGEEDLSIFSP